jgi:hypothetical protein
MQLTQNEIEKYFHVGDILQTGGNRGTFKILEIKDDRIRIKSKDCQTPSRLLYTRLSAIITSFNEIDPNNFTRTIGIILSRNGLKDEQNESYLYGFSREYLDRRKKSNASNGKKINLKLKSLTSQSSTTEISQPIQPTLVTLEEIQQTLEKGIENSKGLDDSERAARLKNATGIATKVEARTTVYKRNPDVIVQVLKDAQGKCGNCLDDAPFVRRKDTTPYLEVHHRIPLAIGGKDTVENSVALCPNCHRKLHFG